MSVVYPCGSWSPNKRGRVLGRHRNAGLELVLVRNGSVTWEYDGQPVHVPPRHVSFTWPWQVHGALNDYVPSSELYWITLPLRNDPARPHRPQRLEPGLGLSDEENRRLVRALNDLDQPVIKASNRVCDVLPEAIEQIGQDGGLLAFRSRALLLTVLSDLIQQAESGPEPASGDARARVADFLPRLAERCDEVWTLDRMAAACGMGRTHFTRWLKELTGDTPIQHLNRQRIEKARRLLRDPRASVTTTAFSCGFQSSQYFATVFRNFTGHSPARENAERRSSPFGRPKGRP